MSELLCAFVIYNANKFIFCYFTNMFYDNSVVMIVIVTAYLVVTTRWSLSFTASNVRRAGRDESTQTGLYDDIVSKRSKE